MTLPLREKLREKRMEHRTDSHVSGLSEKRHPLTRSTAAQEELAALEELRSAMGGGAGDPQGAKVMDRMGFRRERRLVGGPKIGRAAGFFQRSAEHLKHVPFHLHVNRFNIDINRSNEKVPNEKGPNDQELGRASGSFLSLL